MPDLEIKIACLEDADIALQTTFKLIHQRDFETAEEAARAAKDQNRHPDAKTVMEALRQRREERQRVYSLLSKSYANDDSLRTMATALFQYRAGHFMCKTDVLRLQKEIRAIESAFLRKPDTTLAFRYMALQTAGAVTLRLHFLGMKDTVENACPVARTEWMAENSRLLPLFKALAAQGNPTLTIRQSYTPAVFASGHQNTPDV